MKKINPLVLVFIALLFGVLQANGSAIIDQRWERPEPYVGGGSTHSIYLNSPIGQEFTPTMNNIVAVELAISADYLNMNPGEIQPITATIRDDVITGNALATSTISPNVDDEFIELLRNDPYFVWLYFDFGGKIPITTGNRYVIAVSIPELGALNWGWKGWQDTYNIGIPGYRIINGERWSGVGFSSSFGFRTYAVPEPATLLLLGFGAVILKRKG